MLAWVPACDGFAIVAFRDAGMTEERVLRATVIPAGEIAWAIS